MKKLFLFTAFCFAVGTSVVAQDQCSTFYPFEEQKTLVYSNLDKKGNLESTTMNTIKVVDEIDGGLEAQVEAKILNKKDELVSENTFLVSCINNELKMDISNLMSPDMTNSFSNFEVTISGDAFTLPGELSEGQTLPDATSLIQADTGPIKLNITMTATNRKVEAFEQ